MRCSAYLSDRKPRSLSSTVEAALSSGARRGAQTSASRPRAGGSRSILPMFVSFYALTGFRSMRTRFFRQFYVLPPSVCDSAQFRCCFSTTAGEQRSTPRLRRKRGCPWRRGEGGVKVSGFNSLPACWGHASRSTRITDTRLVLPSF